MTKQWNVCLAQNVRAYATVIVEADTEEDAKEKALGLAETEVSFNPDWSTAEDIEVIDVKEETPTDAA